MINRRSYAFSLLVALTSCTGLKYATPEHPLFAGYSIEWEEAPAGSQREIEEELSALVNPAPNNSVIGMRPTVALHNMIMEPEQPKGLAHLLRDRIGSAPVYLNDVPLKATTEAMQNRLNNRGYFKARASSEVVLVGQRARVRFILSPGEAHRLRNITYDDATDSLNAYLQRARKRSPLKEGQLYDLAVLQAERARVAAGLRNNGWYHMMDDDLLFAVDTSVGEHAVDVRLRVKPEAYADVRERYTIASVRVHGDYDGLLRPNDSVWMDSVRYINYLNNYRPSTILKGVFLRPHTFYSERRSDQTSRYLASYGVFKSVQVRQTEDSTHHGLLHTDVILVPQKRWSLFTELNAVSKSNNFAGPGVRIGVKDRDLFRGAETFTVDLNGRFETQIAGAAKGTNAYEFGVKAALRIPRVILFRPGRTVRNTAPSTRAELGYGVFRRIGLYGMESANASFGYGWSPTPRQWHELDPLEVSYNSLNYSSDAFNAFLDTNLLVKRSFEEQFIVGLGYNYTVSTQRRDQRSGYVVASIGVDEGGNLINAVSRAFGPRGRDPELLFGKRYAQFGRLRPEFRYYSPASAKGDRFVARFIGGAVKPFGNSEVAPFVKQFFVGGTNSVRAFRARSVGPGTYAPGENNGLLIDQAGDIRIEFNAEYRFTFHGYFKGALFADAGNVWLFNEDPQRPGGRFEITRMLGELAVGTGFGLRFDPEVIVVRLDLATPVRIPSLPAGDRWAFDHFKPSLFDNVVINIAVGYPF